MTGLARMRLGRYLHNDATAAVTRAFVAQLADGRDIPTYGTPAWLLAPRDLQIAAALVGAELRRRDRLYLSDAIADELEAEGWFARQEEDAQWRPLAASVRAMGTQPTHAELEQRRTEPQRPFKYTPTPWHREALSLENAPPSERWCWGGEDGEPDPVCPCRWCQNATTPTRQESPA